MATIKQSRKCLPMGVLGVGYSYLEVSKKTHEIMHSLAKFGIAVGGAGVILSPNKLLKYMRGEEGNHGGWTPQDIIFMHRLQQGDNVPVASQTAYGKDLTA